MPSVKVEDMAAAVSRSTFTQSNPSLSPSQRPSYFDFASTTGLYPSQNNFDEEVIKKLDGEFDDTTASSELSNGAQDERLKTFLRIRPVAFDLNLCGSSLQIKDEQTVVASINKKHFLQDHNKRQRQGEFKFSKVLGPQCGQSTVFEECVTPIVEKFLRHENCLIFSYGATNSGKTYTMQGHGTEYGIIPRTLDYIFERMKDRQYRDGNIRPHLYQSFHHLSKQEVEALGEKRSKIIAEANIKQELMNSYRLTASGFSDRSASSVEIIGGRTYGSNSHISNSTVYSVWVSYAELYNERVYDLLDNSSIGKNKRRKELKLLQDRNGYVYIKDLTELPVTSDEEAYKLFLAGRKNLQFAATQMNQHSSRSHSFFTIRVVSIGIDGMVSYPKTVHRMTFCDLAGIERANQTENKGFRLHESGNINNSLTVLLKVIRVLREKQLKNSAHGGMLETIPFRESKLTHIFKSYFTSSTHICMIVNANPDPDPGIAYSTMQVLENSAVASSVVVFRPLDLNIQSHANGHANMLKHQSNSKSPASSLATTTSNTETEDSSDSDAEEYGAETVVAPKTLLQKLQVLQLENTRLKMKLVKCEQEKEHIRQAAVKAIQDERIRFSNRLIQTKQLEENVYKRRISLMKHEFSPGNRCSRCSPPKMDMEDIDETFEEDEEEEETVDKNKIKAEESEEEEDDDEDEEEETDDDDDDDDDEEEDEEEEEEEEGSSDKEN